MVRVLLGVAGAIVVATFVAAATVDHWLFAALNPGEFRPGAAPPAPDYAQTSAWAALPSIEDGADVFLAEFPRIETAAARADVFYVHPTTWVGSDWNGPYDDPAVIEATERGGTRIQASAFNGCCAVYAPRYRQANGRAFIDPDAHGDRAIELAYSDVARAFGVFLETYNRGRPFILASHSQGSVLASRLLRERIAGREPADRLVAAYLVGFPIRREALGGIPVCRAASQTGCMAGWNARGPRYPTGGLEFRAPNAADTADPMAGAICVDPLSWSRGARVDGPPVSGALFFDSENPEVLALFDTATCRDGRLVVSGMGSPPRDAMSRILDWMMGPENYHPIEYQLFYLDIRHNAIERVAAFIDSNDAG